MDLFVSALGIPQYNFALKGAGITLEVSEVDRTCREKFLLWQYGQQHMHIASPSAKNWSL